MARPRIESDKKKAAIELARRQPFINGERCYILGSDLDPQYYKAGTDNGNRHYSITIMAIDGEKVAVKDNGSGYNSKPITVNLSALVKDIDKAGANPFDERNDHTRAVAFALESVLFKVGHDKAIEKDYVIEGIKVAEANWNPFVYNQQGQKEYYQRPFVWSLRDNQLLIESIYRGIECGRILVRKRSWGELTQIAKKGETELAFTDIVDGKQRLNAVVKFLQGEYPDMHGNYFADLSDHAQRKFTDHQLFAYAEMPENSKDSDVIYQFLRLNFSGVPQSEEHIEFVKSLQSKI